MPADTLLLVLFIIVFLWGWHLINVVFPWYLGENYSAKHSSVLMRMKFVLASSPENWQEHVIKVMLALLRRFRFSLFFFLSFFCLSSYQNLPSLQRYGSSSVWSFKPCFPALDPHTTSLSHFTHTHTQKCLEPIITQDYSGPASLLTSMKKVENIALGKQRSIND